MINYKVIEAFSTAKRILFITGAGVSAESGIPTYRGATGLYNGTETEDGMPIETALSGDMLRTRPEICWKHIARIEASCRGKKPNAGHEIIRKFEIEKPNSWVLTQNVDGLHRAAGTQNLIEMHGGLDRLFCIKRNCGYEHFVEDFSGLTEIPPKCPTCSSVLRPDVVLFGESLPRNAMKDYQRELEIGFHLVVSIGTTSVFPYISYPVQDAVRRDVPTIEINPDTTEISLMVDHHLRMGAGEALTEIWNRCHPA